MDYKEKYEQALEVAQRFYNNSVAITKKGLEDIFPELAESEDERIRKTLIRELSKIKGGWQNGLKVDDTLAWLEKQGEQKPADKAEPDILIEESYQQQADDLIDMVTEKPAWSEEDENLFRCAIDAVKQESKVRTDGCLDEEVGGMVIDWLKSLKERVQPKPKQEWSEDDERYLNNTISYLKDATEFKETAKLCIDWLKSLRPQNTWKPSEGQLECLGYAIEKAEKDWSPLTNNRIYLTLKALKEQLEKL